MSYLIKNKQIDNRLVELENRLIATEQKLIQTQLTLEKCVGEIKHNNKDAIISQLSEKIAMLEKVIKQHEHQEGKELCLAHGSDVYDFYASEKQKILTEIELNSSIYKNFNGCYDYKKILPFLIESSLCLTEKKSNFKLLLQFSLVKDFNPYFCRIDDKPIMLNNHDDVMITLEQVTKNFIKQQAIYDAYLEACRWDNSFSSYFLTAFKIRGKHIILYHT